VLFDTVNPNNIDQDNRRLSGWVFSDYFTSSYSNKKPIFTQSITDKWVGSLWEIRQRCGKEFTDKVLFYTYKKINDRLNNKPEEGFNKYFSKYLFSGEFVVDNEMKNRQIIMGILKSHDLMES
jgi:hypothetical protein